MTTCTSAIVRKTPRQRKLWDGVVYLPHFAEPIGNLGHRLVRFWPGTHELERSLRPADPPPDCLNDPPDLKPWEEPL